MSQTLFIIMEALTPVRVVSAVASPTIVTLRERVVSAAGFMAMSPEISKLSPAVVEVYEREYSGWSMPPYSGVTVIVVPALGATPLTEYMPL